MASTQQHPIDPRDLEGAADAATEVAAASRRRPLAVTVRPYAAADWPAVEALVVGQLEQEFIGLRLEDRRLLGELEHDYARETLLVAVSEEARSAGVVGVIALKAEGYGIGRIQVLTVSPDQRRQGVGTALLREVLSEASRRGLDDLIVDAPRRNDAAVTGYFDATGFRLMAVTLHTSIFSRGVEEPLDR